MQQWLIIYNCQTQGLANSISLLAKDIYVEHFDIWQFQQQFDLCLSNLSKYEKIIVHPQIENLYGHSIISTNKRVIPSIEFSGYHPDFAYVSSGDKPVTGPMHAYNSLLTLACYKQGIDIKRVPDIFTRKIFGESGYLDMWQPAMSSLIERYAQSGIDISRTVNNWGHTTAFMHSIDHPKIAAVYDCAKAILASFGEATLESDFRPHDNLAPHPSLPIYPPISEEYGVPGSYNFKIPGQYKFIDLEQFIHFSYESYKEFLVDSLQPDITAKSRFDRVCEVVAEYMK